MNGPADKGGKPVLLARNLDKHFPAPEHQKIHAVNDVSFAIAEGEVLGMVGESGSGKSTVGRLVLGLLPPTAGTVEFDGKNLAALDARQMRASRADMQMVFQDPWSALNPRMAVGRQIAEPLLLHTKLDRRGRKAKVAELADRVRLPTTYLNRLPADLSGGQLQRVCIAKAIATEPKLIVLDEPTSSLDLSVRAGILDLLADLRRDLGVAMLFISHDLGTVKLISDRIVVLYLGTVVEEGAADTLFDTPAHPYTQALLSAHLPPDPAVAVQRHLLEGEVPSPIHLPPGCRFAGRCPLAIDLCRSDLPSLDSVPGDVADHRAACIRIADGANRLVQPQPQMASP